MAKAASTTLRSQVLAAVAARAGQPSAPDNTLRARLFGRFVQTCLLHREIPREAFAQMLELDPEVADALLEGTLPASEIDDTLLRDIARVIKRRPQTLRALLDAPTPQKKRRARRASDPAHDNDGATSGETSGTTSGTTGTSSPTAP